MKKGQEHAFTVLKIRTICHTQHLWKLAQTYKQLCLLCPSDPWNLPDTALLRRFPGSFEIHWVRQYLVNVVLFFIKDLQTFETMAKLKCYFYIGAVDIFRNFDTISKSFITSSCM